MSIGLGDSANWGKGYGNEATRLALGFAFNELNLHRVQLTVFDYNSRAIHLYEKLGFQQEGIYREFLQRDGRRFDMYLYGLLRHEWEARERGRSNPEQCRQRLRLTW
jgi:RimJ/RimL family protein N-acetyltransferase